jgi:hypothetical protein
MVLDFLILNQAYVFQKTEETFYYYYSYLF